MLKNPTHYTFPSEKKRRISMKTSKKILAVLIAVITVFGIMSVAVAADDTTVYVISGTVDITINTPIADEKPSIEYISNTEGIIVQAFTWYDTKTGGTVSDADSSYVYENGRDYTAKIAISPKEGYKFDDALKVTVNGDAPSTIRIQDNTITVEVTYSCDKGASDNAFFAGLKNVLLNLLRILRDIVGHIIGF